MKEDFVVVCEKILSESEKIVFKSNGITGFFEGITNIIYRPYRQFITGAADFMLPTSIGMMVWMISFISLIFIAFVLSLPPFIINYGATICIILPILAMLLATPSVYALSGIKNEDVLKISSYIIKLVGNNEERINLLGDGFNIIEARVESRAKFYRMLIGAFWTYNILISNLEAKNVTSLDAIILEIHNISFYLVLSWLIYLIYKRSTDILLRSIRFAIHESYFNLNVER